MLETMPHVLSTAILVTVTVFALGLVLWMYGWGQREPTVASHLGTTFMSVSGLCAFMIVAALSIGFFVSSLAQVVQTNAATRQQQQQDSPAR